MFIIVEEVEGAREHRKVCNLCVTDIHSILRGKAFLFLNCMNHEKSISYLTGKPHFSSFTCKFFIKTEKYNTYISNLCPYTRQVRMCIILISSSRHFWPSLSIPVSTENYLNRETALPLSVFLIRIPVSFSVTNAIIFLVSVMEFKGSVSSSRKPE